MPPKPVNERLGVVEKTIQYIQRQIDEQRLLNDQRAEEHQRGIANLIQRLEAMDRRLDLVITLPAPVEGNRIPFAVEPQVPGNPSMWNEQFWGEAVDYGFTGPKVAFPRLHGDKPVTKINEANIVPEWQSKEPSLEGLKDPPVRPQPKTMNLIVAEKKGSVHIHAMGTVPMTDHESKYGFRWTLFGSFTSAHMVFDELSHLGIKLSVISIVDSVPQEGEGGFLPLTFDPGGCNRMVVERPNVVVIRCLKEWDVKNLCFEYDTEPCYQYAATSEIEVFAPAGGGSSGRDVWSTMMLGSYHGCSNSSHGFQKADVKMHPNRYLWIATSGGLNQQRTGITDAIVAAYILNATLVIPRLDQKSYWKDSRNFSEIFEVDWFISFLSNDEKIITQLPTKGDKVMTPYKMRVPRKCTPKCYQNHVLLALNKKHAVQLTKFDCRLSNILDTDLQKLRCRVNYNALRFTDQILGTSKKLAERMRMKSKHFIALHLSFEPDMLAFSGCYLGGGDKERVELASIRKRWKTLHASNPDKERRHGRCPLTPEEVGLMLRALGFGIDVHIYVASGEVYGGEETLAPLKALFPNFHSKETIARNEELAPFSSFSSRMAALDYIVWDESDVFVAVKTLRTRCF